MNFYHYQQRLVQVGFSEDYVERNGGRREVFEIAEDEQLFGLELDYCKAFFRGAKWIKMRLY